MTKALVLVITAKYGIIRFSSDDWKRVLSFGNRAALLNVASSGGYEAVTRYLDSLPQQ